MNCRSCGAVTEKVLDLGVQHLSDFREDTLKPPSYPLVAMLCPSCLLVQLEETVPREQMYHERYGFKSGVNGSIRADLADVVACACKWKPGVRRWLDIACNDGTLLAYVNGDIIDQSDYQGRVITVGVDPVSKFCDEARQRAAVIVNDYFAPERVEEYGPFDVVTSISMFYDVDDPNEFVAGVERVLAPEGVWVIQQNYLLATLDLGAVDNFCHEHITYFSLHSLAALLGRHGLQVFSVSRSTVNGGSFRTVVCREGEREPDVSVAELLEEELAFGLNDPGVYETFADRAQRNAVELYDLLDDITGNGMSVYAYGASTRGGTLFQYADVARFVDFAVDRNPEKVGKQWSALGVQIISEEQARNDRPDYMLVSPWFFRSEFIQRERDYLAAGGSFIFPLPEVEIV